MIAQALATNPRLVLADEPTGNLDTRRSREVLGLIRDLCRDRGTAVLLATHDPQAATFADRVHELRDGRLHDYKPDELVPARRRSIRRSCDAVMSLGEISVRYRARLRERAVVVQELPCRARDRGRRCAPVRLAGRQHEPRQLGAPAHEAARRGDAVPARRSRSRRRKRTASSTKRGRCRASALHCRCSSSRRA